MSQDATGWRLQNLEQRAAKLESRTEDLVSKSAFRERRDEMARDISEVKAELEKLEAATGVSLTALRSSIESLEKAWQEEQIRQRDEKIAQAAERRKQERTDRQTRIRYRITTAVAIFGISIALLSLLWNVLRQI